MPSKFMYVLACTGISFLYKVEYSYVYTAHIFLPPTHVPAVTCIVPALGTVKDGAMWLSVSMLLALWELVFYALGAKIQKWNRWITQSHPILVYTLVGDHDRMVFIFIFICLGLEEHLGQKDFIIKQGMALPGQSSICDSEGHCMGAAPKDKHNLWWIMPHELHVRSAASKKGTGVMKWRARREKRQKASTEPSRGVS